MTAAAHTTPTADLRELGYVVSTPTPNGDVFVTLPDSTPIGMYPDVTLAWLVLANVEPQYAYKA
jgi:hypothetical protein